MQRRILCAGFGGQGVLAMGQMLTYAGMVEGKEVSWFPSYGPEMRGGAANCSVVISDDPVGAPNVDIASDIIVMNQPSFDKFKDNVLEGGNLFINSSLIDTKGYNNDKINIYEVPVSSKAQELGNIKMANMVMLGSFLQVSNLLKLDSIIEAFSKVFGDKKKHLIPVNKKALDEGMSLIKNEDTGKDESIGEYRKTPASFADMASNDFKAKFVYDDKIFDDPIETATYALKFEENAIEYYKSLDDSLEEDYRMIFKSVAKQEEEHVSYIKKLLGYLKNKENIEDNYGSYETIAIFDEKKADDFDGEILISALKNALYIEYMELEFYKKACKKVEDEKSRKLYSQLVKWEESHFDQFDKHTKLHQEEWWADQSFSAL